MALIIVTGAGALFIQGRTPQKASSSHLKSDTAAFVYPADVKAVIDDKCYGCHSKDGKSEKAKAKLMWDDLPNMVLDTVVAKLDDISEMIEKGKMPPEKFIQMKPDAAITPEQGALIKDWADKTADALMGQ